MGMTQVFISYSRKDISFIETLVTDLKNTGLEVWYDVSHIAGGARWRSEIENALRNSQYVIVVLSPDSIVSEWVSPEEKEFIDEELQDGLLDIMGMNPLEYFAGDDLCGLAYGENLL